MSALATPLLKHLVRHKLCSTFSEAQRLLHEGNVRVNGERTFDISVEVLPGDEIKVGPNPMFVIGPYNTGL